MNVECFLSDHVYSLFHSDSTSLPQNLCCHKSISKLLLLKDKYDAGTSFTNSYKKESTLFLKPGKTRFNVRVYEADKLKCFSNSLLAFVVIL